MLAAERASWMRGSPYRGALLALVVEQPAHGYLLAIRLGHRLGPAYAMEPNAVYQLLDSLELRGLISRCPASDRRGGLSRYVFSPTPAGERAVDEWMAAPIPRRAAQEELVMRVTFSRPRHVPDLEAALKAFEQRCVDLLRETEASIATPTDWHRKAMGVARLAVREDLEAKLRWIAATRAALQEAGKE